METIRWGLLSTANINRHLIPAIRAAHRSQLTAVASRNLQKSQQYAREKEIPIAFGSYEEMLASDAVDAVYISLPNHLHAEWSIRALEAGKHVLCEKPFALTLNEVDRMIAASRASGRILAEAFMYRHHPQTLLVKDMVTSGKLGQVRLIKGNFSFMLNDEKNIRLEPEMGGGSLWDIGVYPLSYAQYIAGSAPLTVNGEHQNGPSGIDQTFVGQMTYPNGIFAQISCSFALPFATSVDIYGTKGTLHIQHPFNRMEEDPYFWFIDADETRNKIPVPQKEIYLCEVENMEAAILDGAAMPVTLDETRNHILTCLALLHSAKTHQPVTLANLS